MTDILLKAIKTSIEFVFAACMLFSFADLASNLTVLNALKATEDVLRVQLAVDIAGNLVVMGGLIIATVFFTTKIDNLIYEQ